MHKPDLIAQHGEARRKIDPMSAGPQLISSRANPRVKQLRGALAGYARLSGGLVAIEGEHLLEEAIASGMVLKCIFLAEGRELPLAAQRLRGQVEILHLTEDVFTSIADTRSPQGVAALLVPPVRKLDTALREVPLLLIASGLQDPGNLGTLIRSAAAFGATGVLTTPGTVNPWNGKSLRASAGSIFGIPVVPVTLEELLGLKRHGVRLLAAVGNGIGSAEVAEIQSVDLTAGVGLLIGNEGAGLGSEFLDIADARVTIPSTGAVESLNAAIAGSLLLFEAFRQRSNRGVAAGAEPSVMVAKAVR